VRVDVHTHFYPAGYLDAVRAHPGLEVVPDPATGLEVIRKDGARVVTLTPAMRELQTRLRDMDRCGIDVAVLSLSIPNVYFAEGEAALTLCRAANDGLLALRRRRPDRLRALASVPLQDPDAAVQELERALAAGMDGVILGTHVNGRFLSDPAFGRFWEACQQRAAVVFLHPMEPLGVAHMRQYALGPLVGFVADTTLIVSAMIFSGWPERYPRVRLILPHLGGTLPYLAGRLDIGYRAYPECRANIPHPPSHYLRRFYYDTVSFHGPALECAIATAGADRLVLGTDYPHVIGDMEKAVASVQALPLSEGEKAAILGGTAAALFGLAG
jgi:aminocarboxymuconate-semialdehyde decarboxylase